MLAGMNEVMVLYPADRTRLREAGKVLCFRSVPFGHFAALLVSNARFLARVVLTGTYVGLNFAWRGGTPLENMLKKHYCINQH